MGVILFTGRIARYSPLQEKGFISEHFYRLKKRRQKEENILIKPAAVSFVLRGTMQRLIL
jgi:hypothetical protein